MIDDIWYKNAIIYCLDVETYVDSNGDGVGDFEGLTRRLDYLAGMGVTCLWLQPFYPSPNRDNGYDVSDYYGVHPKHGTLGDFVEFMSHAEQLGMRVIVDLVASHTSNRHPWFLDARKDPQSKYRDWYVWTKTRPADHDEGMVFPGVQKTTWTRDPVAGQYYFHRFYDFQPDLNTHNRAYQQELLRIMGFWLRWWRRSRPPTSGRARRSGSTSCAATTSSTWGGSPTPSAKRSSRPSARRSTCSCTTAASAAAWRRC
jgi:maltose alpha-D-glucosyltransferase / alpha-amylase